jgi:uncharacterized membrane protein
MIQQNFQAAAELVGLAIEAAAIIIILGGAIEALFSSLRQLIGRASLAQRRDIWLRFASWIVLGLEFALGADVIQTAIAPSWDDIGKLAAIATIRTALNYFLVHDIDEAIELPAGDAVKSDS